MAEEPSVVGRRGVLGRTVVEEPAVVGRRGDAWDAPWWRSQRWSEARRRLGRTVVEPAVVGRRSGAWDAPRWRRDQSWSEAQRRLGLTAVDEEARVALRWRSGRC